MRRTIILMMAAGALLAPWPAGLTGLAQATFPYPAPSGDPSDYTQYKLPPGVNQGPNDLTGAQVWKYAATPEPGNEPTNSNPYELNGVRGAHVVDNEDVDQAWRTTTGRPDVTITVMDSGIKWNDAGAMNDLRKKTHLNKGELPKPEKSRTTSLEGGSCTGYDPSVYDANGDGVFNVVDYACDARVESDPALRTSPPGAAHPAQPRGAGPADVLDPQDVLMAFSNGDDLDGNGFKDDIVGWDFLDNDNDPFDDVQYGHGTGEAEDSSSEADNGGALSACPNCMVIYTRVGDSFVADVNRFAQAAIYATDNGASVIQEALGTLNHSKLGKQAVDYAYDHGVTVIASAADEAAQHHNWPSSYPHVIMVNSVTKYPEDTTPPPPSPGRSYLQFNGCTNFMANVTLAIPSVSCSSDATGRAAGMAGLVYSAALNAHERATGPLADNPSCTRANGDPCVISANEVRQLMASGTVGGTPQSDDVDFLSTPKGGAESQSCNPPLPGCTDPNDPASVGLIATQRPLSPTTLPPNSRSYPARKGHDQFYGHGRVNMDRALDSLDAGNLPPEVEITSPDGWWNQVDPASGSFPLKARLGGRGGAYTCRAYVAPGSYPNNDTGTAGDFKAISSSWCDGTTARGPLDGKIADVQLDQLKALFPPADVGNFDGTEPGARGQTSNGRPNTEPYGFTVKIVATSTGGGPAMTGEDRRNEYLHRDSEMLNGFPVKLPSDGAASPLLVDLDGDNRNELVLATSDGDVHAYRRDGSELPGWPVKGDALPIHAGRRSFGASGAFLATPAAADLDHDGAPEVVAADLEGKLYGWDESGRRVFSQESNIDYSGKPLTPFADVRKGHKYRTQHGFIGSPVLADLDRNDGGRLEVVAGAMDRHVYAWNDDGTRVPGFPMLVADYSKLDPAQPADPQTHALNFKPDVGDLNQGAIVDTPAVGDLGGDERPEIVVGTNEEYAPGSGGEPPPDFQATSAYSALSAVLKPVNSRLYALKPEGDPDGPNAGSSPYVENWPTRIAFLLSEVLPVVGEGITGAPVIGPVNCPEGGQGPKVGAAAAAGPGYVLNPDASSCYGNEGAQKRTLATEGASSARATDQPSIPAFGHPAFADLGDGMSFFVPAAGLIRALDVAAHEYQQGGQDQLAGFNAETRNYRPNFPVQMNDLQFLTGPSIADIDGQSGQELLAASASLDLQAYDSHGLPVSKWPKLTSDWTVANPLIGSFGQLETSGDAKKVVISITRSGILSAYSTPAGACTKSVWPRFHHDNANSGDYRRDAVSPGRPYEAAVSAGGFSFLAPGDDLLCGRAAAYELVHSNTPIDGRNFKDAQPLAGAPTPDEPGKRQSVDFAGARRYVALRARDDQGNVGRPLVIDRGAGSGAGAGGGPGGGAPACTRASGRVKGKRLGPVYLGQRSSRVRRLKGVRRIRRRMHRVCLTDGAAIRVGYGASRRYRGRAVLLLSSSRRYKALGLRPGARARRPHGASRHRVGGVTWYAVRRKGYTALLGVRRGRVREVGLADRRLTRGRRAVGRFLRSF